MLGFLRGLIAPSDITEFEQAKWAGKAVLEGAGRIARNEKDAKPGDMPVPLIEPLPEDHNPELVDLIQFFRGPLGVVPNSVLTMQRRPKIARAFTELNKAVMENLGRVTAEQKRLIGFVASHAAGCRYCEAHTILAAERFKSTPERLAAIWDYRDSPLFTAAEKAAFEFALAAASVPNAVTPEIGAELRRHWNDDEIVEILGVVALFGYLNRWNDSMATTLEDIGISAGERNLTGMGWGIGKHRA